MTLDTVMTSGNVPSTNKKRSVMAGKFNFEKFAKADKSKDPDEPDADDKKPAKGGKAGKFKAAYSKKFGK